ncbi:hypothetical protein QBC41DRAFT_65918 [Cercophora samala]|uniref:Secreted protein n=1 Tax=Cercophora samala TaxID=330535 RepID=A0AA39ZGZ5_9PEZI|nr:hypothetical protein QBC41DRAFT_65918 [Cercophora samala]
MVKTLLLLSITCVPPATFCCWKKVLSAPHTAQHSSLQLALPHVIDLDIVNEGVPRLTVSKLSRCLPDALAPSFPLSFLFCDAAATSAHDSLTTPALLALVAPLYISLSSCLFARSPALSTKRIHRERRQ